MSGISKADELIHEAIRRLEADVRVGVGYNWRHVYRTDAPHDRDRAINVLGKRNGGVIGVGIYFENHLHEFLASEESALSASVLGRRKHTLSGAKSLLHFSMMC